MGAALLWLGCGGASAPASPRIGDEPIYPAMVEFVAERDGLSVEQARENVVETLRWVAASRAERDPDQPELSEARRDHLLRTARARLWLHDVFEPQHQPEHIPADDPLLLRARADGRWVHPELVQLCQLIVVPVPTNEGDRAQVEGMAADPAWRTRAAAKLAPLVRHATRLIDPAAPAACQMLVAIAKFVPKPADGVKVRVERAGGYVLDSCAEQDEAGNCTKPTFAPEWTDVIRQGPAPGFRGPFFTRFGLHFAVVMAVLPASGPEDPDFDTKIRQEVLLPWRRRVLDETLSKLRTQRAVLVAGPQHVTDEP